MIEKRKIYDILMSILLYLAIITSSYDVALNIEFASFTFRFTQIMLIIASFLFVCLVLRKGTLLMPVGIRCLSVYVLLNTIFLFRARYIKESVGYEMWLLLNVICIFIFVNHFSKNNMYTFNLLRIYVYSFTVNALILLIQVVMSCFFNIQFGSYRSLGKMTRFSAFTFEPSYYVTYMLVGWIFLLYLIEKKNVVLFSQKKMKYMFIFISLSIVFSGSRMGWLFAGFYLIYRFLYNLGNMALIRNKQININLKYFKKNMFFGFIISLIIFIICYLLISNVAFRKNIFVGLGIFGESSHSSSYRIDAMKHVYSIFSENLILGCSLGDITPRIFEKYANTAQASAFVILEQFAATGIFGGISIIIYIFILSFLYKNKKIKRGARKNDMEIIEGLCIAFLFQTLLLCLNQNILRPYYWINMSVLSALYTCLKLNGTINYKLNREKYEGKIQ